MPFPQTLYKYDSESLTFEFDFGNLLNDGESISSEDSATSAVDQGSSTTGLSLGATAIYGAGVQLTISAGTADVTYRVRCKVVTSSGNRPVVVGYLKVLGV